MQYTHPTNTRAQDIILAAKYHYGHGDPVELIRNVIKYHNWCDNINDYDMLMVIHCDVHTLILSDASSADKLFSAFMERVKWDSYSNGLQTSNDPLHTMLNAYVGIITMTHRDKIGSLPPPCEHIKKYLKEYLTVK